MATGKVDSLDGSPEVHGITGVVEILGIDSSGQKSFYQINILAGGRSRLECRSGARPMMSSCCQQLIVACDEKTLLLSLLPVGKAIIGEENQVEQWPGECSV